MSTTQTHLEDPTDPEPTVAWAVRWGRSSTGQTLRRLAKSSGVSLAQLSRLEAGRVARPSVETLVALAPALNEHPTFLLVLAGHLSGEPARAAMREIFGGVIPGIAREYGDDEQGERLRREIDEADDDDAIRWLAVKGITLPVEGVDFPASLAGLSPGAAPDGDLLAELIGAWRELTPDRRWRLLEIARDLRTASLSDVPHQPKTN